MIPDCPRPMYHYEASSGVGGVGPVAAMGPGVPPGFSAINLSVKIAAAQAQRPRSPAQRDPRDPRPAIDLSTSSGSPQVRPFHASGIGLLHYPAI